MEPKSLQETHAPQSICFGCGPANAKGLRIRSFSVGEDVVCDWTPEPHHEAFPGVLNGGIIGTLLDCHLNWTAANALMKRDNEGKLPSTVTAEYSIKLLRPTPTGGSVHLVARPVELSGDRATIEGRLEAGGKICATARGLFVAVKPGHPAYFRW
jgi:acyl-coenzyme A thioesterase PaaI-like protein